MAWGQGRGADEGEGTGRGLGEREEAEAMGLLRRCRWVSERAGGSEVDMGEQRGRWKTGGEDGERKGGVGRWVVSRRRRCEQCGS